MRFVTRRARALNFVCAIRHLGFLCAKKNCSEVICMSQKGSSRNELLSYIKGLEIEIIKSCF